MTSQNPSSADATTTPASAPADARIVELDDAAMLAKHEALTAVDHVIGLEATIARLELDLRRSRSKIRALREKVAERDKEIAAIRASTTWKVGRAVTRPIRGRRG
ncbi:MAG TPA: hypothetical protein VGE38_04645 [Nocardioides sp.]|uniref:hypothetical protein n=1 Tax=Nocardioides sp. TaxID=35761 RepID=UPI002EDA370C